MLHLREVLSFLGCNLSTMLEYRLNTYQRYLLFPLLLFSMTALLYHASTIDF